MRLGDKGSVHIHDVTTLTSWVQFLVEWWVGGCAEHKKSVGWVRVHVHNYYNPHCFLRRIGLVLVGLCVAGG